MSRRLSLLTVIPPLLALAAAGCGSSSHPTSQASQPAATTLIARALVDGVPSTFVNAPLPVGTAAAPVVTGSDVFVAGGYAQLVVTVPDSVQALLIGASDHAGYFVARLPAETVARAAMRMDKVARLQATGERAGVVNLVPAAMAGSVNMVVAVGLLPGQRSMPLVFAAQFPHSTSRASAHPLVASAVADTSARLQVVLSWSAPVDLDLHVQVTSAGHADSADVFYANRSARGGTLDLDSNPWCSLDNIDNENVTWGHNVPDTLSTYTVRVDKYSACATTTAIPYVVTIVRCDTTIAVINGTIPAGSGDQGGWFGGAIVRTIDFRPCAWDPRASLVLGQTAWQRTLARVYSH